LRRAFDPSCAGLTRASIEKNSFVGSGWTAGSSLAITRAVLPSLLNNNLRAGLPAGLLVLTALLISAPALAQSQPGFDCNLFGPTAPCDPYLLYPPRQGLQHTVRSSQPRDAAQGGVATLRALFARLGACWRPPPLDEARAGMQLTVRLAFKRDGHILGVPRFTYVSRDATNAERARYQQAVLDSLTGCAPFPFAGGLGGAVAGRPLTIRYIDDRKTHQRRI